MLKKMAKAFVIKGQIKKFTSEADLLINFVWKYNKDIVIESIQFRARDLVNRYYEFMCDLNEFEMLFHEDEIQNLKKHLRLCMDEIMSLGNQVEMKRLGS